jgi:fatty-acyl-CoA synthase
MRTALLGPDGEPVAQGEPGEICVSGPLLSGGYWNRPEETSESFRDGWLHTGDIAREDEDGYWYIVDRTKDMIVTGGFNVFPREVEDVVAEHPMVAQVAVIGVPHEKFGEAVTAIVVLRPDAPTDDESTARMKAEIQEAVRDRKGSVQAPKEIVFVEALPVTALGKLDKKALRARYWTGDRAVG